MAQLVKALATKPTGLGSIPRTHINSQMQQNVSVILVKAQWSEQENWLQAWEPASLE